MVVLLDMVVLVPGEEEVVRRRLLVVVVLRHRLEVGPHLGRMGSSMVGV